MPRGKKKGIIPSKAKEVNKITQPVRNVVVNYADCTTDFDEVTMFNQLFANLVERSRGKSIAEMLDYILQENGVEMNNAKLMVRINKLGMRADLYTPSPSETKSEEQ